MNKKYLAKVDGNHGLPNPYFSDDKKDAVEGMIIRMKKLNGMGVEAWGEIYQHRDEDDSYRQIEIWGYDGDEIKRVFRAHGKKYWELPRMEFDTGFRTYKFRYHFINRGGYKTTKMFYAKDCRTYEEALNKFKSYMRKIRRLDEDEYRFESMGHQ